MSRRKQTRAIQKFVSKFFKQLWQLSQSVTKATFQWLLRTLMVTRHRRRRAAPSAGFVLPTVALLLVVVALVIGAILFRTGSRTNQVISERNQQVIYNAATPAIDRAKAKLEYLFKKDERRINGVPPESDLMNMLLTDDPTQQLSYTLPDETPLNDISGDGQKDAAWSYKVDTDGDGTKETTVAYSIALRALDPNNNNPNAPDPRITFTDQQKAKQMIVRNGPITATQSVNSQCKRLNSAPESGWDLATQAALRKTFQVTAAVISNKGGSRTISTLEFQQDREIARANKWGAWFRYDMHIHPLPAFRWNGAIHTEGSLFLGGVNDDSVQGYLISAPASCLYDPESNSEVSIGRVKDQAGNISFAGQVMNANISGNGNPVSGAPFHIYNRPQPITDNTVVVDTSKDSVGLGSDATNAEKIALDPIVLFTKDISKAVDGGNAINTVDVSNSHNNVVNSDPQSEWISKERLKQNRRIIAKTEQPPYVDDTYRADDRLGPKPKYNLEGVNNSVILDSTKISGSPIASAGLSQDQKSQLTTNTTTVPNDTDFKTLGLDGYWERRARAEGLRIIVGPRLELGNTFGWGGSTDPLYPPDQANLKHEPQQHRTWRDNLAAVQATTVYHYTQNTGDIPLACIATTAHPGTQKTIADSKDFSTDPNTKPLQTNFFTGKGTNGWEYSVPPTGLGGNWDTAIKNLANFAGEKEGAFPPTQGSGTRVYPHPYLSMWGNFSNLRRAIDQPANNPISGQLSIADQSYKYSAACTMGILARNMVDIRTQANTVSTGDLNNWTNTLETATLPANPTVNDYITALSSNLADREKARIYSLSGQIERDRDLGFAKVPTTPDPKFAKYQYQVQYLSASATPASTAYAFGGITYDKDITTETATQKKNLTLSCDISSTGNNYFGLGAPSDVATEKKFIRLAVALCPSAQPKFPSLFYLFPKAGSPLFNGSRTTTDTTTNNELYIQKTQTDGISASFSPLDPANILLDAKPWGSWQLPTDGGTPGRQNLNQITIPGNGQGNVALLDSVIFDGREAMPIRVLDIDLDLLRNKNIGSDTWFPRSGVFYAFREDAVREDAIARPGAGAYTNPIAGQPGFVQTKANPTAPQDPTVQSNGVSPKPVDFIADPERRPYGFRLRNGVNLMRDQTNPRGITFVSDNPVAIQGNFNLHSGGSGQEFDQQLGDSFTPTDFYQNRTGLNGSFAALNSDTWRPAEILSDALLILSKDFKEGSVEEGIRRVDYISYKSMNAPKTNSSWIREDGSASDGTGTNAVIPIKVGRNGNLYSCSSNTTALCSSPSQYNGGYVDFSQTYQSQKADKLNIPTSGGTTVNAILVSAVVPARKGQSNGGMHNFPRLLENWSGVPLRIAGSFIQLNFSTYATAPYDQDAWESGSATQASELTYYYNPPQRVWGYDVGLQYAPAGPLSKRFITSESPRSEFYEELKANDPYVCNLRRALLSQPPSAETSTQVSQECQ